MRLGQKSFIGKHQMFRKHLLCVLKSQRNLKYVKQDVGLKRIWLRGKQK